MRPQLGPIGLKASEGLVNRHALLSSCSPVDPVLLRDIKTSSTLQPLATVTKIHTQWDFSLHCYMQVYTCKLKSHAHMCIFVDTWSLLPVRKQNCRMRSKKKKMPVHSCKHTQRHRYAWTLTDYRHKNRCLQTYAYVHASHTYTGTHRCACKHRCEPTTVNILAHLEEYICNKLCNTAVSSWRYLSKDWKAHRFVPQICLTAHVQIGNPIMEQGKEGGFTIISNKTKSPFLLYTKHTKYYFTSCV